MKKILGIAIIGVIVALLTGCTIPKCIEHHYNTKPAGYRFWCGPSMGFDGNFKISCWYRFFPYTERQFVCDEWEEPQQ